MDRPLSERLDARAAFEDKRVLDEARAMGFVPEVYTGSQTGALLRDAAEFARRVEEAAHGRVIVPYGDGPDFALANDETMEFANVRHLRNQRVRIVPEVGLGGGEC